MTDPQRNGDRADVQVKRWALGASIGSSANALGPRSGLGGAASCRKSMLLSAWRVRSGRAVGRALATGECRSVRAQGVAVRSRPQSRTVAGQPAFGRAQSRRRSGRKGRAPAGGARVEAAATGAGGGGWGRPPFLFLAPPPARRGEGASGPDRQSAAWLSPSFSARAASKSRARSMCAWRRWWLLAASFPGRPEGAARRHTWSKSRREIVGTFCAAAEVSTGSLRYSEFK